MLEQLDYEDTSVHVTSVSIKDTLLKGTGEKSFEIVENVVITENYDLRPVFRIPSVIITNNGTILVSCENREVLADKGEIDILVSRNNKEDSFWEVRRVIPHNASDYGRSMNPVFLIDRNGKQGNLGRIYLFACHVKGGEFVDNSTAEDIDFVYKYSDDDGKTWSPEYSLKNKWDNSDYTSIIPSAANGIQLDDGTFLLPTMVVKDGHWHSGLLYKKVHEPWTFSTPTPNKDDNECTVYTDKDNNIILDCRTFDKVRHRYMFDLNRNCYTQLESKQVKVDLKAEIHKRLNKKGECKFLLSYVDTPSNKRENITLFISEDTYNWRKVYRIQDGHVTGSYSNVASYGDLFVVAYETGKDIRVQDASCFLKELDL